MMEKTEIRMMRKLSELYQNKDEIRVLDDRFIIPGSTFPEIRSDSKKRVNIIALGDVGGTLLMGLRLLGGGQISSIGLCDLNEKTLARYEMEINQILPASGAQDMPPVYIAEDPLDCDILLFCATAGIPPAGQEKTDVRLVQLEANRKIVKIYTDMAKTRGFDGAFYVVSDPVDLLCQAAAEGGISASHVRGFGLGVMYARAAYYAEDRERFLKNGRVFGPHGDHLVVADSVLDYDEATSLLLTKKTITSNLKTRELGFKPYIAPALSSGSLSLLSLLRGEWQYSSLSFGSAFLGVRNRLTPEGREVEDLPLDDRLFERIEAAYADLKGYAFDGQA
jgi:hypothetical protein